MKNQPTLTTDRLILRPFSFDDAPAVTELVGAYEIAYNTLMIPHPYEEGMSEEWISTHQPDFEAGKGVTFAIVQKDGLALAGAISLHINKLGERAEMGYWIGVPYWNKGICTEAAGVVLEYGFSKLQLNLIFATHFVRNSASGKVMKNIGMKYIARLPQWVKKWDEYLDLELYAVLKSEFKK